MPTCDVCGESVEEALVFACNECDGRFCSDHRLPEKHRCPGLMSDDITFGDDSDSRSGRSSTGSSSDRSRPTPQPAPTARDQMHRTTESSTSSTQSTASQTTADRTSSATSSRSGETRSADGGQQSRTIGVPPFVTALYRTPVGWIRRLYGARTLLLVLLVGIGIGVVLGPGLPAGLAELVGSSVDSAQGLVNNSSVTNGTGVEDVDDAVMNATHDPVEPRKLELAIHEKVNEERMQRGKGILTWDGGLAKIARYHSRDMANNSYFAHTAPDGETMHDRYVRFDYACRVPVDADSYKTGGENLHQTFAYTEVVGVGYLGGNETEIAEATVNSWLNSSGHRENMLAEYWRRQGIGVSTARQQEDGDLMIYVTQNFC